MLIAKNAVAISISNFDSSEIEKKIKDACDKGLFHITCHVEGQEKSGSVSSFLRHMGYDAVLWDEKTYENGHKTYKLTISW